MRSACVAAQRHPKPGSSPIARSHSTWAAAATAATAGKAC